MKKLITAGILSLLILSCSNEDQQERQARIQQLTQQVDSIRGQNSFYSEVIFVQESQLTTIKDSINTPWSDEFKALKKLSDSSTGVHEFPSGVITYELLWGDSLSIIQAMENEPPYGEEARTVQRYINAIKLQDLADDEILVIKYSSPISSNYESYLFEILADVVGLHIGTNGSYGSNRHFLALIRTLSLEDRMSLVNHVCDQIFVILDHNWKSDEERRTLINAFDYILRTAGDINYRAKVVDGKFENSDYEENWNGIQKFFYRTEKKFPGSSSQIRVNIYQHMRKLTAELNASTDTHALTTEEN